MNEEAVPKNTEMATKYLMVSYLISPALYYKAKNQNTMPCLRKLSSTKITMKTMKHFSAWFQQQEEFNSAIEEMTPSNLTSACRSFICRQEGETGHFTIKNRSVSVNQKSVSVNQKSRLGKYSPPLRSTFSYRDITLLLILMHDHPLCGTKSSFITVQSFIYTCSLAPTCRLFSLGAPHKIAKER